MAFQLPWYIPPVKSTKRALKGVAGNQLVTDKTLLTFMTEAESLMNSRSLTHASSDCNDLEALTPNHYFLGRANFNVPLDVVSEGDLCSFINISLPILSDPSGTVNRTTLLKETSFC